MGPGAVVQIVALILFSSMALAQDAAGDPAEQRRRLIEQKLRLVESLVNSPAAQSPESGHEAEMAALVQSGRPLLERARESLAAGRLDEASAALDEALRNATKASARQSGRPDALSASVQLADYRNLSDQLATYRGGIVELANRGNSEARTALAQIEALQAEAGRYAANRQMGDANRKLAEAYKLEVETLSRLRAGETVTLRLKFNTPADEFAYERRRFQGSEILVDIMIGEGHADGDRREVIQGYIQEGKRLSGQAGDRARAGDYRAAVTTMEKAVVQLNRALQAMGAPVF